MTTQMNETGSAFDRNKSSRHLVRLNKTTRFDFPSLTISILPHSLNLNFEYFPGEEKETVRQATSAMRQ